MMRVSHSTVWAAALTLSVGMAIPAQAADPVKVGILVTTSGPYANWGRSYQQSIDLYLDQHNGKDGNPKVEVLYRDVGGDNPPRARQLAQDLIVRDEVAVLGGLEFTTTVLAMADLINQAKIPFVIFNSATSVVTDKSPNFVRASFTQWQSLYPLAQWAVKQKYKTCEMFVADYAPGQDAIDAFSYGFTHGGGKMLDTIRVPMGTTDFSSYFQRVHDNAPNCLVAFMPGGPMSAGTLKGFAERGFSKQGIQLMGSGETPEYDLPAVGDAAIGTVTSLHYGPYLDNPENKAFVKEMVARYGDKMAGSLPSFIHVQAYDGMEILFRMLRATGGKRDLDKMMAAAKGYSWKSPRGPVEVDPETRELVQNIYIRRVEKLPDGKLGNVAFETFKAMKDPWHTLHIGAQKK
ncbi:MAG TPA: ABC transporter substrate-binding protein [Stellaceae bacterium]|jgi:branched-chain amino acid transport system substrate-binding protein|nr:ABC transporter substrate-binding protein [Stellaceae bacterium]